MGLNFWILFISALVVLCVILAVISVWWEKRSERKKYAQPGESEDKTINGEDEESGRSL